MTCHAAVEDVASAAASHRHRGRRRGFDPLHANHVAGLGARLTQVGELAVDAEEDLIADAVEDVEESEVRGLDRVDVRAVQPQQRQEDGSVLHRVPHDAA